MTVFLKLSHNELGDDHHEWRKELAEFLECHQMQVFAHLSHYVLA